jgi:hypothetical protein
VCCPGNSGQQGGEIEDGAMTNLEEESAAGFQLNTGTLMVGAVLIGIGSLIGFVGLALSGAAVATAARRYVNTMEVPPSELAKQHWARARAATVAGAGAWRNGTGAAEPAVLPDQ